MRRKPPHPEPWMFGIEVTVNGEPIQASIGRFTLLGRIRMGWRALRGKPRMLGRGL